MIAAATLVVALVFPPITLPPAPTPDVEHAHAIRAERARAELVAEREAARRDAERRAANARAAHAVTRTPPPGGDEPGTDEATRRHNACVRAHESDTAGGYQATDAAHPGAEVNMGAYQFSQSTWDATARHAGRPELVGVRPDHATPAQQDALAAALYRWQGDAPWGNRC